MIDITGIANYLASMTGMRIKDIIEEIPGTVHTIVKMLI